MFLNEIFFVFRTGKTFISDEELRPERSASIHRSNSFLCLYSSSGMWITNRMLFDHPLYGLNIDRVLGFHDYTLGQVTQLRGHSSFETALTWVLVFLTLKKEFTQPEIIVHLEFRFNLSSVLLDFQSFTKNLFLSVFLFIL